VKSAVKTAVKKVRAAIGEGSVEEALKRLKDTTATLDKAVTKGVLHRNNASRKISRLTTAVNSISSK
jgi:small subunit ribosomal protein S20